MTSPPRIADSSLEDLAITIMKLTLVNGLLAPICLEDVLQPWILEQYPEAVRNIPSTRLSS